ncbi:hypothetical protein SAMN02746098_03812 [Desulfosporosinus lacus DSM 15449]|uniref:Phage integrase, N-terminal SAM-like domain n=1 Tax=Desulfosporosinus lacus DSM 15449 TaxID=1121420 RepID=A0A1M5ZY90_9FIRM|nr:hypothetical protein SAMN02746098_03812 [Desulfosporosinus lacus DSM 15449]
MSQTAQPLSSHLQKMKIEMELRGYSPQTQRHYLCHLRQLEKHTNKLPSKSLLTNSKFFFITVLSPASATVIPTFLVMRLNSFLTKCSITTGPTMLLSVLNVLKSFLMYFPKTKFSLLSIRWLILNTKQFY